MRSNLSDNVGERLDLQSLRLGVARDDSLTEDFRIPDDGPVAYFLNPTADRTVWLPSYKAGRFHVIFHTGGAFTLNVKDSDGFDVVPIGAIQGVSLLCSGVEWRQLGGTSSVVLDPVNVSSPDGSIDVAVVGADLELEVNPANVDHNALNNYVADEHVAHSSVDIATGANSGLSGGGNITADRALVLDINNLVVATPVLADSFAFYDLSGTLTGKATLTQLNSILSISALVDYDANKFVDHSMVSVQAGEGLTGGGVITATITLDLDISGLTAETAVQPADLVLIYDVADAEHKKITYANFTSGLSVADDSITNAKLDNMAAFTIKANATSGSVNPTDVANFTGFTSKGTPTGSDILLISDAAASNAFKKITISTIPITAANEASDTTCFPVFFTGATGDQLPKTNTGLTYNSSTNAFGVSTIELGHASDTTLSRSAAGVVQVEGKTLANLSDDQTWTGQQGYDPVALSSSAGTAAWNVDTAPFAAMTLTENTTLTVNSAVAGRHYVLKITNHASAPKTVAYTGANFDFIGAVAPTMTATNGAIDYYYFVGVSATLLHEVGRAQGIG